MEISDIPGSSVNVNYIYQVLDFEICIATCRSNDFIYK